jgi:phosphoribosylglycinamide formyltransferase-1
MKNLGILLSGRGSNFEAIAKNVAAGKIPGARIAVVISNKSDAGGLETASRMGLTVLAIPSKGKARQEHDRLVVAALKEHKVDLVHFVDAELDHGVIILQKTVPVLDSDDEHSLSARILEQEHIAYSEAINLVLYGKYKIVGRKLLGSA